ncbi:hypothetical protein P5673_028613 [Acropora cervicornis]|uniref:Integrase core domain-containing protein n=1 Tax=Acropora cervicornis TaxID=6130 RepID=A0AAD9UUS8_ACRCE|nr:hypothetical protein P5673_028613 [Acropora cervicornis]
MTFFDTGWRVVVHGGINGFSRLPVYLHASNNNKAATVLHLFEEAVNDYGLSNKGAENVDVAWFMLNHPQRGPGRGSMITGRGSTIDREAFQGDLSSYGIDWQGPVSSSDIVEVPDTSGPLQEQELQSLARSMPLHNVSISNAVDFFVRTVPFVSGLQNASTTVHS